MPKARAVFRHLPLLGLVVCAVVIYMLAEQNADVAARFEELRERTQWPHAGYAVPTFTTTTLSGDTLTLGESLPGQKQLLLVFDTECPYCLATLPAWKRIADEVVASDPPVQVVGISLDSADVTRAYVEEQDLPFPVVLFPNRKLQQIYRAWHYPLVVLLDAEGRTLYSRLGLLDSEPAVDSVLAAARLSDPLSRPLAGEMLNPEPQEVQP